MKIICMLLILAAGTGFQISADDQLASTPTNEATADSFFGMTKVWEIHLQFDAHQWQAIQPPEDVNWDGGAALEGVIKDATAGKHFHSDQSSRPGLAGYMGVDHQYGRATVTIGDDKLDEVGVRYKGNGTFLEGHASGKFSYKIDFNEYHDQQEYRGLTKVNLNSCISDPSMLREALSYELFKEAGIAAPRVAWAKVYLTVTGLKEREYQGLYELVEQIDKRFLKNRFGSAKGLLVKPSTFGAFRYLGDDWENYKKGYYPKTDGTEQQQQRMIEFARLVHLSSEDEFANQIENYMEIDQFLNFLAVNVVLSNLDSFLGGSQNYYAYLEPESNKILLLPWDLDHSFATLPLVGNSDSRRNLSIYHPQIGDDHRLIERVLAIPEYRTAYLNRIQQLMDGPFARGKMFEQIDEAGKFLRPLVALEGEKALQKFDIRLGEKPQFGHPHVLKYFVEQRRESIEKQLTGQSRGAKVNWGDDQAIRLTLTWLGVVIAALLALAFHAGAWLWGVLAGFKGSTGWGLMNLSFYPISPIAFGFFARRDIGQGAAISVVAATAVSVAVVVVSILVLSP